MHLKQTAQQYASQGFAKLPQFFEAPRLSSIHEVINSFHQAWLTDNQDFYQSRGINSSGLTADLYLDESQRLSLFQLVCEARLLDVVKQVIPAPLFLGTQLFFDPFNPKQKNYWHRDPQYHLTVEEQKQALTGPEVLHVRIPLTNDPGIEVIPGSHKNWDNEQEFDVRLEKNGHSNSESLSRGVALPLQIGDVLLFSANMIHRGLYGNNRLVLDILYCENDPVVVDFINLAHQPNASMLSQLEPSIFL